MSVIDERIERGVAIFRRAGDDSALLGGALLAFHGAIERFLDGEHFRAIQSRPPELRFDGDPGIHPFRVALEDLYAEPH